MSVHYCLLMTLFGIDRGTRWKHQLHSHQHFVQFAGNLAVLVMMHECDAGLLMIEGWRREKKTIRVSNNPFIIKSKHRISPGDATAQLIVKSGGKRPAAVCKLIIIPPGRCLINLTDA